MTHTDETPRRSPSPCCNGCPGWAVFDTDIDPSIQQCDDCWYDQADAPGDEYYQAHPVCAAELEAAITRGGGSHYFPYNRRAELGATLVEVWEENGECPDSDES